MYLVIMAVVLCVLVVVIGIAWKKDARTMVNVGLRYDGSLYYNLCYLL